MLEIFKFWRRPVSAKQARQPYPADPAAIDQPIEDADLSVYLRADVPEATRREALRAVFRQPGFNRCDGLDDYDEDYRLARTGSRLGPNRQS